ncbi:MAG: pyridoxal kinase [Rhodospirillales bacterium 20-64-7]|nr:MAG: pyridoxal kinase [Rhodospirillales bacterium 20-64-7]
MAILSFQSQVVAGHVGNSVAVFALQRLGHEVFALPTVLLSHHPGHGGAEGGEIPADLMARLLAGLETRGCLPRCDAVVSGYFGVGDVAETVRAALARIRATRLGCTYLCDPVLGDDGRTYVSHEVVAAVKGLARIADIITPNAYELSLLSGQGSANRAEALGAMRIVQGLGPSIVLLTSFYGADTPEKAIDVMVVDRDLAWRLTIPKLHCKFSGAGDLFASLFLHFWLPEHNTAFALGAACSALREVLLETIAQGADELSLIMAQNRMVSPSVQFTAEAFV